MARATGNHKGCRYLLIVAVSAALISTQGSAALLAPRGGPGWPAPQLTASDAYVGAQACARCHSAIHAEWRIGRHSKMLQPASGATVKGAFSRGRITLRGSTYGLRVRDGQYFITESNLTGKEQEHRIDYTLGSRRIQHYLTTTEKGWIVVLPPSWDVQRSQWFHNVEIIRPDEDDRQIVQQWNRNCVGCHVSGQDNHYDPATHSYHTQWTDFGTTCERCHGPGRAHIERYEQVSSDALLGRRGGPERPAPQTPPNAGPTGPSQQLSAATGSASSARIVRPTRLDPVAATAVCAQCHSLRTVVNPDYKPGDRYYDYFMPVLEYAPLAPHSSQDRSYWPDGRPRRFSNDAIGLWQSACFLRGGETCTTCHVDPHLPNIERNPQLTPQASSTLCTRCHQEIGERLTAHTRHTATSVGSSCIECHMPKTVVSIKATMRDHTIGVPAPENTVRFGIPNACTECHHDKSASWAADVLQSWAPRGRRVRLIAQAVAFSAARAGRPEAIEDLIAIAEDQNRDPLTRANAVGYLGKYADPRALDALLRSVNATHPAIRATAMAGLQAVGRRNPSAHQAALAGLKDSDRAVRIASLLALTNQVGAELGADDLERFRRVGREFTAWSRMNRDNADLQRAEGVVLLLSGDFDGAAAPLEISLDLNPESGSATFFLALARIGQRRLQEARTLLQKVPHNDPYYAQAQAQLKKLP